MEKFKSNDGIDDLTGYSGVGAIIFMGTVFFLYLFDTEVKVFETVFKLQRLSHFWIYIILGGIIGFGLIMPTLLELLDAVNKATQALIRFNKPTFILLSISCAIVHLGTACFLLKFIENKYYKYEELLVFSLSFGTGILLFILSGTIKKKEIAT